MSETFAIAIITVSILYLLEYAVRGFGRLFGVYTTVQEKEAKVYVLFGDVIGVVDEPGFHFLWAKLGWRAFFVCWLGRVYRRSQSVDQEYIRSIPVNSEEGTPMGIGVWHEMFITDPVAHIFKNVDPQGSLNAHVRNATIKSLSNLPLSDMLVNRHTMSRVVREEVTTESAEWGYKIGSVYIRKVHFRDEDMVRQIEEKVVNRLRQVTSAIKQDGVNQVNIIMSRAEQEASVEFAKAAAIRPQIVASVLEHISRDKEVLSKMFEILEYQKITENPNEIILIPEGSRGDILAQFLAAEGGSVARK